MRYPGPVNLKNLSAAVTPRTDNVRPHRAPAKWVDGIHAGASVVFEKLARFHMESAAVSCSATLRPDVHINAGTATNSESYFGVHDSSSHARGGLDPHSAIPPRWTWCKG